MTGGSIAIVLQARMGSARLPGKALRRIGDATLLGHCLSRLRSSAVAPVIVATTTLPADEAIVEEAWRFGVSAFRGPADDVLARFLAVGQMVGAEYLIRATGDNPAVDPGSVVRLVEFAQSEAIDHALEAGLPCGSTVEIVRTTALQASATLTRHPADREHVTSFLRRADSGFRCAIVPAPTVVRRPELRFTVDTAEDLAYMRRVIPAAERKTSPASLEELIRAADMLDTREEVA